MIRKLRQRLKGENWRLMAGSTMLVALCLLAGVIPAMVARWPWTGIPVMAYVCVMIYLLAGTDDDGE